MARKKTRVHITPCSETDKPEPQDNYGYLSPGSIVLILILVWGIVTYYAGKYGWEYIGLPNTADLPPPFTTTDSQETPTSPKPHM